MEQKTSLPRNRSKIWQPSREELVAVVSNSVVFSDILKHYGMDTSSANYRSLRTRLWQEQIDFSHIKRGLGATKGKKVGGVAPFPLDQVLIEHSTYSRRELKIRLLKDGLLKNQCYECGIGPEWNGKPLSLRIDHINGVSDDNRIENLRILCPNCHAQTETFGSKRRKGTGKQTGPRPSDINPEWRHTPKPGARKVDRPSKEELSKLLWEMPTTHIGKRFGVSGNSVIKWALSYGLSGPSRGYWAKKYAAEMIRPTKKELGDMLWKMPREKICRKLKIVQPTLTKWIKLYELSYPPPGYWHKKINQSNQ